MKLLQSLFSTLLLLVFVGTSLSAQFDDLYYDPDLDNQYAQESEFEYSDYDEDYYDDEEGDDYDEDYYEDYSYATRINRFRRPSSSFNYFAACLAPSRYGAWDYDPFYDPYNSYAGGSSIYISFGNNYNPFRYNRYNRFNRWSRPVYSSWYSPFLYSNNYCPPNYYNNSYSRYGNSNYGYNSYGSNNNNYYRGDRVTNSNKTYASRKSGGVTTSTKGRLYSPRTQDGNITSKINSKDNKALNNRTRNTFRKGDISDSKTKRRISNDKKVDTKRQRSTFRGSSSTKKIDTKRRTTRKINSNRTQSRTKATNPNTSRKRATSRSNNSSRSSMGSNRSSSNRSSVNRSSSSSRSSSTTKRSTSSRKKNN